MLRAAREEEAQTAPLSVTLYARRETRGAAALRDSGGGARGMEAVSTGTKTGGTVARRAAWFHETGATAARDRSVASAARGDDGTRSVAASVWAAT